MKTKAIRNLLGLHILREVQKISPVILRRPIGPLGLLAFNRSNMFRSSLIWAITYGNMVGKTITFVWEYPNIR